MVESTIPELEIYTNKQNYLSVADNSPPGSRIPVEVRTIVSDPFEAYCNARIDSESFYLETTGPVSGWGYFGIKPIEFLEILPSNENPQYNSLKRISDFISKENLIRNGCDSPYPCGVVGWLSYELSQEIENIPPISDNSFSYPILQLGLYDCMVSWVEPRGENTTLRITSCPKLGNSEKTFALALENALDMAKSFQKSPVTYTHTVPDSPTSNFQSDCGRETFCKRVQKIKDYIYNGDTFQVNIAHKLIMKSDLHPVNLFRALRSINPAPYSALLEFPSIDLIGASPELLFYSNNDTIVAEPIAGTRPRGLTNSQDLIFEHELLDNKKERAEHAMLVDLCRNDLGKVSDYGTVNVEEYRRVDRYSSVMHLVSSVKGDKKPNASISDVIKAIFPGGTITGAPKPKTMEIISEIEDSHRGPYTGSVGIFGFDNQATLNIIIRTFIHQNGIYQLPVGAGIVHDSVPEKEYEETLSKAKALINSMDSALSHSQNISQNLSQ
jgi:anthranilate synthase component 1